MAKDLGFGRWSSSSELLAGLSMSYRCLGRDVRVAGRAWPSSVPGRTTVQIHRL